MKLEFLADHCISMHHFKLIDSGAQRAYFFDADKNDLLAGRGLRLRRLPAPLVEGLIAIDLQGDQCPVWNRIGKLRIFENIAVKLCDQL